MAEWTDHPQKLRGQLVLIRPTPIKTALADEPGGITYPIQTLNYDNEQGEDFTTLSGYDHHKYGQLTFGDAPGGRELGDTIQLQTDDSGDALTLPNTPNGVRPGEINIADNDYITWWDSYKPFYLSPRYIYDVILQYWKKGVLFFYSSNPVLNVGAAFLGRANSSGYRDVSFDLGGSFNPNHACYTTSSTDWNNPTYTNLTSSSENGAQTDDLTQDDNATTYWQTTGNTNEWLKWYRFGDPMVLRYYSVRCSVSSTAWATWEVQYSDDDVTYTTVAWEEQTTWTSGKYYFFVPDLHDGGHPYWRILLKTANGGATFQTHEVEFFTDYQSSPYSTQGWRIADGSFAVGSASTDAITGRFYPGFRWIHNAAYSVYGNFYPTMAHRPVCVLDTGRDNPSDTTIYPGSTGTASETRAGYLAISAWRASAYWRTDTATTGWLAIEFPTWLEIGKTVTIEYVTNYETTSPNTATFEQYNPLTDTWEELGSFSSIGISDYVDGIYTFELTTYGFAQKYRLNISANNGGSYIAIKEIKVSYRHPHGFLIEQAEVLSHEMVPEGQTMQFRVYEDISDYPPDALVMFGGEEYYNGVNGSLSDADPTGTGREGLFFVGWVDESRTRIQTNSDGRIAYVDITVLDVAGWMQKFPGVTQAGARKKDFNTTGPFGVGVTFNLDEIPYLNIDRMIWYLLYYDAINLELADFEVSGTWETYAFPVNQAQGGNIYRNADGRAQTIAHRLTFNKMGQYKVLPDPILQAEADRTAEVQAVLTPADIASITWSTYHSARIGRHWADAQQRSHEGYTGTNKTDPLNLTGFACVAPDQDVWGQGAGELDQGNQLVIDQDELNAREGQRYAARSNPKYSTYDIELKHGGDNGIDPARMSWVEISKTLTVTNTFYTLLKRLGLASSLGVWPLTERLGTVADNVQGDSDLDGSYYVVTLNGDTNPDGQPCPTFDGTTTSYVNLLTPAFAAQFDRTKFSIGIWIKVDSAALTDGNYRSAFGLATSAAANYFQLDKDTTNNQLIALYRAGGSTYSRAFSMSDTNWHHFVATVDTSASEMKVYLDAVQQGATLTGFGVMTGTINMVQAGAYNGSFLWDGALSIPHVYNRVLTSDEITALNTPDEEIVYSGGDWDLIDEGRYLVVKKTINNEHDKMSRKVTLTVEREVNGVPADTWVKPS